MVPIKAKTSTRNWQDQRKNKERQTLQNTSSWFNTQVIRRLNLKKPYTVYENKYCICQWNKDRMCMSKNVTGFRKQLTQPTVRMFLILLANHLNLTVLDMISMGIVRKIQCVAVHSGNTVSECTCYCLTFPILVWYKV